MEEKNTAEMQREDPHRSHRGVIGIKQDHGCESPPEVKYAM
jgi:hypothetical protein